ncbi:MAG: 3'-5' exonuclease domain-containing protein 2 [Bacteroidales bacterium]|jgi:ribonuclease D|nr:3'-5' exonuclease domain-containing protein 2 [Bacteroidales bacterium]
MTFASEISREELQSLPLVRFQGEIRVAESVREADELVKLLEKSSVLGFDTETRPSFTKGRINRVALLQLSTGKQACLFRLCKMPVPPNLIGLLSDPNLLKIGVALKNDMDVLCRSVHMQPKGFIDLQDMMKQFTIKDLGLAKMTGIILGVRISKSQQLSNWENAVLTEAQQRYAATDAWACYEIYRKLSSVRQIFRT